MPLAGRRLRQDSPPEESGEVDFQPRRDVKMQWHYFLLCDISYLPFALKPTVVNLNLEDRVNCSCILIPRTRVHAVPDEHGLLRGRMEAKRGLQKG